MKRKIYPPISELNNLKQPLTSGERKVLDVFDQNLAPEWEIYLQPHLNGLKPDFVLLNPYVGLAVFEIKDWNLGALHYFTQKNEEDDWELWAQDKANKRFPIRNPVEQVEYYKKEIYDLYCPRLAQKNGFGAITAGIIFPYAPRDQVIELLKPLLQSKTSTEYPEKQPISGIAELNKNDISIIFPESARKSSFVMQKEFADDLRGWLVEPDFSITQRNPLVLDDKQQELATTRTTSGRRHIVGPAGSGKSMVLAARAANLANAGNSVLIVTFNITLWHYLRDLVVRNLKSRQASHHIVYTHFHSWCHLVCQQNGYGKAYRKLFTNEENEDVLNIEGPLLTSKVIDRFGTKQFDAIWIDEGQDYHPLWLQVLSKACIDGGEMVLLTDDSQNIYGTAGARTNDKMREAGFYVTPNRLKTSYRLSSDTARLAQKFGEMFLPKETYDPPLTAQDPLFGLSLDRLRWVQCSTTHASEICADELVALMRNTGDQSLSNADITLITSRITDGEEVTAHLKRKYNINTRNTYDRDNQRSRSKKMAFFMGDARVKATTIHSFKGWESRMVVLYITEAATQEDMAGIYTGLTRLRTHPNGSWMTVVSKSSALKQFGKNFPDYEDKTND